MTHMTKDKGDLAVAMTLADLRKHGIICCLPISEHLPFDVVAIMPDTTTLVRLQVKYRKATKEGSVQLVFRSNYYDSKKIYSKYVDLDELDAYAVYCPDTDQTYYIRIDELLENAKAITLRLFPPKSQQKNGIWLAENFINPMRLGDFDSVMPIAYSSASRDDEQALDFVMLDLMKQNIQPMLPRSAYLPFHVIGVCEDMKTLMRYRVGMDVVYTTPYVDTYAIYSSTTGEIVYISANSLSSDITKLSFSKSQG